MLGERIIEFVDSYFRTSREVIQEDFQKWREIRYKIILNEEYKILPGKINGRFLRDIEEQTAKILMRDIC